MAQRVNIELVDDLDGSTAVETVTFGLDGKVYEIDLNKKHANALRKTLDGYVEVSRKVTNGTTRRRRAQSNGVTQHPSREVRDWARTNGYEVSDRGAIPTAVREAFAAAH